MDLIKPFLALFKTIKIVISILYTLYNDWSRTLAQASSLPGLPVPNPTSSYWQDDPPYPELVNARSPGGLPTAADIVIIGSGITGVAAARTVLREWAREEEKKGGEGGLGGKRVVVLEARQLCSGATGRNGGHIKASLHEVFHTLVERKGMGRERAAVVCGFQFRHLGALVDVARAEGIEEVSECRTVETVDFAVDEGTDEGMKAMMEEFRPYAPEGFQMTGHSGEQARERYKVNERVVGAVSYPAGAIFPYRFVTALWKKLLDEYPEILSIETNTEVERVEAVNDENNSSKAEGDASLPYAVVTSRGRIQTRHVVHATNAFASQLVPGLRSKGTSGLCHMSAQRAGRYFPEKEGGRSWSVIYGQGFDYITQRPTGELMVGGGFFQGPKQGMDMIGIYDDSKVDALTLMHIQGVMPAIFDPGHKISSGEGMGMIKAWSGVIGFSPDLMPLVGRLDPRITSRMVKSKKDKGYKDTVEPGEWISAYFCGDGMVWAWLCGTALGIMLAGSEGDDVPAEPGRPGGKLAEWFPRELYASWERVKDMDIADLADAL